MTGDEIEALCAAWAQSVYDGGLEGTETPAYARIRIEELRRVLNAGQACATALRALAQENEALHRRNDEHVQGWIACAVALLDAGVREGSVPDGIKALTAQLAALRADKERLDYLSDELFCDEFGGVDIHEKACELAGGKEPTAAHYRAAVRAAISSARTKGRTT